MNQTTTRGRVRIGLALGADRLTAVLRGTGAQASVPYVFSAEPTGADALNAALEELRLQLSAAAGLELARAEVDVALLPPLAEARLVSLPPLRKVEAEQVLRRDAARYFVGSSGARALAVRLPARGADAPAPVLAVSASAGLIEQVCAALTGLGWRVRSVGPALAGWLAAASRGSDRTPGIVLVQLGDTLHLTRVQRSVRLLRRAPLSSGADLIEAIGVGPGRAFLWTDAAQRTAFERALVARNWHIERTADAESDAATVAAQLAGPSDLELVPLSMQLERQSLQRQRSRRLVLTAVVLLVASALAELWGTRRELSALRAQRAAIKQEVTPLLAARDSINTLAQRRANIDGLRTNAPLWTSALFDLAMLLPSDTHLRSLRATGDTLTIEASSARAGDAMQALRSATTLGDVRLKGQVERELEDGATSLERFSLQARLLPRDSLASRADTVVRNRKGGAP
jgi:Tfp pilus assembly protein PilN